MTKPFIVLCAGGSDSGGGAGIQADVKAVTVCGCYATTVITALTAQNTRGIQDIFPVPGKFIAAQMDAVLSDIGADAVKTGMLLNKSAVEVVAEKVHEYRLKKVVVDPVMIAKGGHMMMQDAARKAVIQKLLPQAFFVTPNIPEAEALTGLKIRSVEDMKKAATVIGESGVKNVVIKGGHLPESRKKGSVDILYDGKQYYDFRADWIDTKNTHGTGCTFASVLAAHLARGFSVADAVSQAKRVVTKAIAGGLWVGKGHGPVHAGATPVPAGVAKTCLDELQNVVCTLTSVNCGLLIPEVSCNLVYAKQGAKDENDVAGFPGRIIRLHDAACVVSPPAFGASQHMAHVVLTVMKKHPDYRCAMNIRYGENVIDACRQIGYTVSCFNRADEPVERQDLDGCTLEWGVHQVLARSANVPDIIYDTGGWGKEPMIRVLGRNPADVVGKVLRLLQSI